MTRSPRPAVDATISLLCLALCLVAFAGPGCASREKKYSWSKPQASTSDLEKARSECTKRAEDATAATRQDWPAVNSMINVFLECMKAKGWELDAEDDDD